MPMNAIYQQMIKWPNTYFIDFDGITYTVLGGLNPNQTDSPVAVAPLQTAGLPAAPTGYEYRTFRLIAADGLPSSGFMRVRVTTAP